MKAVSRSNVQRMSELPHSVRIREVGPRDGFQNEPEVLPTDVKVRLIELLGATGLSPHRGDELRAPRRDPAAGGRRARCSSAVRLPETVSASVLIPNERGLERALDAPARFQEINGFLSASETHNQKNVGRSVAESLGRPAGGRSRAPAPRACAARG